MAVTGARGDRGATAAAAATRAGGGRARRRRQRRPFCSALSASAGTAGRRHSTAGSAPSRRRARGGRGSVSSQPLHQQRPGAGERRHASFCASGEPLACARCRPESALPASGATLSRVTQWRAPAGPAGPPPGRRRHRAARRSASSASAASPRRVVSNRSNTMLRSAMPSMSRTCSAIDHAAARAIAWSSSDSPSRTEPSAARAIRARRRQICDLFLAGDLPVTSISAPSARGAGRSAGSATGSSPAPCADLGRGEDELHVRRRLFQRLEQAR